MAEEPKFVIPEIKPGQSFRGRLGDLPWDRFCTVSLGNWMEAVAAAGVPAVPAETIWHGDLDALLGALDAPGPHAVASSLYDTLEWRRDLNMMFRWDCCASWVVKGELGTGAWEWQEAFLDLPLDDPRAFDILYEYPRRTIKVWRRPWVRAVIEDGFPVEFRAFIEDGAVIGVSSYYPQRPLQPTAEIDSAIEAVYRQTEAIIGKIKPPCWVPPMGGSDQWAPDKVHGTADWLLTPGGDLLFLEGGPPYGAGAHPCCFLRADGMMKPNGVALETDIPREELY